MTSSAFTVKSTKVRVQSTAYVVYEYGYGEPTLESGYNGHRYSVQLIGTGGKTLAFAIGGKESDTISSLKSGGSYKVKIGNTDYLEDFYYLMGTGQIINN